MFKWITPNCPALVLAPMEGVTDAPMRALMTEVGGFSFCVSEFLRVNHEILPPRVFRSHVPEYSNQCRTPTGTPVQIQLLGGNEEVMAGCARNAWEAGAKAIDLNFGCPSPQVNRNDGGASLLRYPDRIQTIVAAVRKAVPNEIPVSAKLRLGWDSMEDIYTNAESAAAGGASWLTIHARTKTQGYAPPAHWRYIGEVRRRLAGIPVVANGDIWTREDFLKCREVTGCEHFMMGRGALANPTLAHQIAQELGLSPHRSPLSDIVHTEARSWIPLLRRFVQVAESTVEGTQYGSSRIKQWLKMVHLKRPLPFFDAVKRAQNLEEIFSILSQG